MSDTDIRDNQIPLRVRSITRELVPNSPGHARWVYELTASPTQFQLAVRDSDEPNPAAMDSPEQIVGITELTIRTKNEIQKFTIDPTEWDEAKPHEYTPIGVGDYFLLDLVTWKAIPRLDPSATLYEDLNNLARAFKEAIKEPFQVPEPDLTTAIPDMSAYTPGEWSEMNYDQRMEAIKEARASQGLPPLTNTTLRDVVEQDDSLQRRIMASRQNHPSSAGMNPSTTVRRPRIGSAQPESIHRGSM